MQSTNPSSVGIAVMAKASAPGRTKTRLVPPLSPERAAALNTTFLKDVADNLLAAGARAPLRGSMAFGPSGSRPFFEQILPQGIGLIESWIGPFGECLSQAIADLFGRGHGAACVLNADSPTLPTSLLVDLARALTSPGDRIVLGPSDDGGYYVLGMKRHHRRLFDDIAWSTDRVAEQTLERAREISVPVQLLPTWYDVDDAASLRRLYGELFLGERNGSDLVPFEAAHTRAILCDFAQDAGFCDALGVEGAASVREAVRYNDMTVRAAAGT